VLNRRSVLHPVRRPPTSFAAGQRYLLKHEYCLVKTVTFGFQFPKHLRNVQDTYILKRFSQQQQRGHDGARYPKEFDP
jgi:hypothetical protein